MVNWWVSYIFSHSWVLFQNHAIYLVPSEQYESEKACAVKGNVGE